MPDVGPFQSSGILNECNGLFSSTIDLSPSTKRKCHVAAKMELGSREPHMAKLLSCNFELKGSA